MDLNVWFCFVLKRLYCMTQCVNKRDGDQLVKNWLVETQFVDTQCVKNQCVDSSMCWKAIGRKRQNNAGLSAGVARCSLPLANLCSSISSVLWSLHVVKTMSNVVSTDCLSTHWASAHWCFFWHIFRPINFWSNNPARIKVQKAVITWSSCLENPLIIIKFVFLIFVIHRIVAENLITNDLFWLKSINS